MFTVLKAEAYIFKQCHNLCFNYHVCLCIYICLFNFMFKWQEIPVPQGGKLKVLQSIANVRQLKVIICFQHPLSRWQTIFPLPTLAVHSQKNLLSLCFYLIQGVLWTTISKPTKRTQFPTLIIGTFCYSCLIE